MTFTFPLKNVDVDVTAVFIIMLSYHMTWYEYIKQFCSGSRHVGGIFSSVRIRVTKPFFVCSFKHYIPIDVFLIWPWRLSGDTWVADQWNYAKQRNQYFWFVIFHQIVIFTFFNGKFMHTYTSSAHACFQSLFWLVPLRVFSFLRQRWRAQLS